MGLAPFAFARSTSPSSTALISSTTPVLTQSRFVSIIKSAAKKRFRVTGPFAKRKVVWHPRKLGGKSKTVGPERVHFTKLFPLSGL